MLIYVSAALAQAAGQGNIIKKISVAKQNGDDVLVIQGLLNARQLANVVIKQKAGSRNFSVTIPNALIDPEAIKSPVLKFGANSPLETVTVKERIQESKNSDVLFVVDLQIQARKEFRSSVMRPISGGKFSILLKDVAKIAAAEAARKKAEAANQQVAQADNAKKRQEVFMLKQKKEIEEKKLQQLKMARDAVGEILRQYHKPSLVQVSIINASGYKKRAYKLSVFLGNVQKRSIEEVLGAKLDIVNISNYAPKQAPLTTIFFRDNYLKAALTLAKTIPGQQRVLPMSNQAERMGVDIEIYLGKDYK